MERPLTANIRPDQEPLDIRAYAQRGGYAAARDAVQHLTPQEVQARVKDSGLRGRGGAGFPTGQKWSFVPMGPSAPHPKYLVINADEMEPGTFKDRLLMEGDPHQLVEGVILSAYAIEADVAYIFLRWAYTLAGTRIERAIAEAYEAHYLGPKIFGSDYHLELYLHVSAGRYICGEETALLNALEGKRGNPRSKPPFPAVSGLWGKPTVVNNVETICNVPHVVGKGVEWFKKASLTPEGGTKLYGASGRVKRPGIWELPMGTPLREILEEHAGGMQDGVRCRGVLPGGASTDFLVDEHLDVPMDFDSVQKVGSRLGTGTIIVLDDRTCPVGMVRNLEEFFAQESCGWCTPCWVGLHWIADVLRDMEEGTGQPALLGGRGLDGAIDALARGEADTLVVLENDVYRRSHPAVVSRCLDGAAHLIVIDHVVTPTTGRADVGLSASTFAEADGTFINNEGRAQRFFRVFEPTGDVQEGWRWIRDLMIAAGRSEAGGWRTLDDITAALASDIPALATIHDVAPAATFRIAGLKVAREPHRYSGRTAMGANVTVHEPKPPDDPDSALSFTMEGYDGQPPSALIPRYWVPGWNSVQAINHYQSEVGGPLRGGDPGRRVIEPRDGTPPPYFDRIPRPFEPQADEWLCVPLHHIFGSEELSVLAPAIAERMTTACVALGRDDLQRADVKDGDEVRVTVGEGAHRLIVREVVSMPSGIAGVLVGLPSAPWLPLPARARIEKVEATR